MKDDRTFGERAADKMKAVFSTWAALGGILVFMAAWMTYNVLAGRPFDPYPFILLNLCLSCIAALQCFILLIAAKRSDAISNATVSKIASETDQIDQLVIENTELTKQIHDLVKQLKEK